MQIDIQNAARRFKQWSLYRLAIELDVPNQMIYSWNSGKRRPNLKSLARICEVLNCTPNDLFGL